MQLPLQVYFHNLESSAAVEANVRKRAERLERYFDNLVSCRVAIEAPHKHHHQGNIYHVTIEVRIPGGEVVASRYSGERHAHEDVYVAIRDAFDAIGRQLKDKIDKTRRKVKFHETPPHGKITEIYPPDNYGIITESSGREIYFNRNSVVNAEFDSLDVDTEVRFVEEAGEEGPQASSVYLIGKHHIVG